MFKHAKRGTMKLFKTSMTGIFLSTVVYTMIGHALTTDKLILNSATSPIAIGSIGFKYPQTKPLILLGSEGGQSWTFVKNISNLPSNLKETTPFSINCVGNNCVVAGEYVENNDSRPQPLLLLSKDRGQSWAFTNDVSGIPAGHNVKYLSTLACSQDTCMTGGFADDWWNVHSEPQDFILLLQSKDSGKSWSLVNGGFFINLKNKRGAIHKIIRSGNHWIAVGTYVTSEFPWIHWVEWPFVLLSIDNGTSWSFITKYAGLPPSITNGSFHTVYCSSNTCFVGGNLGYAEDTGAPNLLRSNNNGESWSVVKNISGFPSGHNQSYPDLNAFSCSDNTCVAVGDWWIDESPSGVPLLLVSHDIGQSWTTVETIAGLPSNVKYPLLHTVHCSNSTCLAGGSYDRDSNPTASPLLLISKDKGLSWSLVKNIKDLPVDFKDASIRSVTCSDNACTAIGNWERSTQTALPLLLDSHDGGQSWTFVQNIIDLPPSIESGWLMDHTGSENFNQLSRSLTSNKLKHPNS